jgi:hypothetical protein
MPATTSPSFPTVFADVDATETWFEENNSNTLVSNILA